MRECLSSWALLGVDFIGFSILEIVADRKLQNRVKAALKVIGTITVPDFDALEIALRKKQKGKPMKIPLKGTYKRQPTGFKRISKRRRTGGLAYGTKNRWGRNGQS